jgi:hypothetical protein
MSVLKRLALAVSMVFGGSLAIAAVAVAAGGGLAPGDYVFTSVSANAQFGMGTEARLTSPRSVCL